MITPETYAEIRRLFFADHLTINAIAELLGIHHETVTKAIESHRFGYKEVSRPSSLDSYIDFIKETLQEYPKIRSTRLLQMLQSRGYLGSVRQLRRKVSDLRPSYQKAYLALNHLPAEMAQVDWGSFGKLQVGRATRTLSCFVFFMSYSRYMFACFTFDQSSESFLRCHNLAMADIGGVPRKILYDNLKACVIERLGKIIRFNSSLLELSASYHFRPVPCNPAAGWEKGGVEPSIRFIRDNFFVGRKFKDLHDANRQLRVWLDEIANKRPWPDDRSRAVDELFSEEKKVLLPLPDHPILIRQVRQIRSGKTPYVRFDLNDYSIPYKLVRKPLTLIAHEQEVQILDSNNEVARHLRSYDRGRRIEDPAHIEGLLKERKKAQVLKGGERIQAVVPEVEQLFKMLAERGESLSGNISKMVKLLNQYGDEGFKQAVLEAEKRKTPRARSVEVILVRQVIMRKTQPPIALSLPEDPRVMEQVIKKSDLSKYDSLSLKGDKNDT